MPRRWLDRVRIALTLIGLAVAAYLTLLHYDSHVPLACSSGGLIDCEAVLASPSSIVLGVPVAVWGLLWFSVALALALLSARTRERGEPPILRGAGLAWALAGTGSVLWLIYQEIAIVGRICVWCSGIHLMVLALLVVHVLLERGQPEG